MSGLHSGFTWKIFQRCSSEYPAECLHNPDWPCQTPVEVVGIAVAGGEEIVVVVLAGKGLADRVQEGFAVLVELPDVMVECLGRDALQSAA